MSHDYSPWLNKVISKDAQKHNYANELFIATDPNEIQTLEDLAPYGVMKNFKGPTETSTLYGWEDYPSTSNHSQTVSWLRTNLRLLERCMNPMSNGLHVQAKVAIIRHFHLLEAKLLPSTHDSLSNI